MAICGTAVLSAGEHNAQEHDQIVIALHTDEFELTETDISELGIGESETIVTESGKTIDLLRTTEGVEVYVDGELLDISAADHSLHADHHAIHKHVEVICNDDEDCGKHVLISTDEDFDMDVVHAGGHHEKVIVIKKSDDEAD